jgi:hypothetical protein
MSTEDELKLKRLSTVFVKALDMTTDSITQAELKEAFQVESGGITAVENAFVSTIGKMKQSVEVKFADICQEQGPAAILVFSASTDKENKSVQQPRAGNMTDELQAYEREILTKEIEKVRSLLVCDGPRFSP